MQGKGRKKTTTKLLVKGVDELDVIRLARQHLTGNGLSPRPAVRDDKTRMPDSGFYKFLPHLNFEEDARFLSHGEDNNVVSRKPIAFITPAPQTPLRARHSRSPSSVISHRVSSPTTHASSPATSRASTAHSRATSPSRAVSKSSRATSPTSNRSSSIRTKSPSRHSSSGSQKKTLKNFLHCRNETNVLPARLTEEALKFHEEDLIIKPKCDNSEASKSIEGESFYSANGLKPNFIVLSENINDMFVFAQTNFGERFIMYFPDSNEISLETIRELSDLPTSIAESFSLKSDEDAENINFSQLSRVAGSIAGHLRPEIITCDQLKTPSGPLIGACAVEMGEVGPGRICSVVYNNGEIEFTALITDDEFESSPILTYPLIHARAFDETPSSVIHVVNSVTTLINDRMVSDARDEIHKKIQDFQEIHKRSIDIMKIMSNAIKICERGETDIAQCMGNAAASTDADAYTALAARFDSHRKYTIRIGDSASTVARTLTTKMDDILHTLKKIHAEIYVESRRVLSPDTADRFMQAESWNYPPAFDFAIFDNCGEITDSVGQHIVEADAFPEIIAAANSM